MFGGWRPGRLGGERLGPVGQGGRGLCSQLLLWGPAAAVLMRLQEKRAREKAEADKAEKLAGLPRALQRFYK